MTRKHREGSGEDKNCLYVSVAHHLLRCSDGTEIIAHTELSVPDTEQMLVKTGGQPFLVAFVFFRIFLWIGKNINATHTTLVVPTMYVLLAVTAKRFKRYHMSDMTAPCERFFTL